MSGVSRRDFLRGSLAVAGATFAIGTSARPVLGANEAINAGVAGIHGQGRGHMGRYLGMKDTRVLYLIDPDSTLFASRVKQCEAHGAKTEKYKDDKGKEHTRVVAPGPNGTPKCVQDIRKALDDKDLDLISTASPNHWHSLITIWSCQAGKDVYVEKPCSHNVHEGRIAVETARKLGRIVQHGTQSRASGGWARAAALARSGKLGKLTVSYGWASKPRGGIGHAKPSEPPKGLDFNIWLGPAPQQPFHKNLVHYRWHWFWDFGNADTGNQGVHQMDIARWGLPLEAQKNKIKVISMGGRFAWNDQGQTPNSHLTLFDYGDCQLIFESCNLVNRGNKKKNIPNTASVSNAFHTTDGVITPGGFVDRNGKRQGLPKIEVDMGAGGSIFDNFIKAVRSRKHTDQVADILQGHLSSLLCHLGAISYRLGEVVAFDKSRKAFGDNTAAFEALEKMEWRMASRNVKIDDSLKYRVGPLLTFDPATEKFVGDRADQANKLISRNYRAPFLVPDKVT